MRRYSGKSALALAVAAVVASPSAMAFDGYFYSGQTARSQALQLDYFTHRDVGNIWVNPALVGDYQNQGMININNRNNHGDGSGGILLGSGAQTFGVYIGRDSVSNAGSAILFQAANANLLDPNLDLAPGLDLGDFDGAAVDPESQFDLFYGFNAGELAFGVRLNYQDNQQDANLGSASIAQLGAGPEFDTIDNALAHFRANQIAQFANDPDQPTPAQLIFNGNAINDLFNDGQVDLEAREFNLSLGFAMKSLGIDGALLLGKASGTFSYTESMIAEDLTLENDGDDNQVVRRTALFEDSYSDHFDIDDGTTLGLSLRGVFMETERSSLLASFTYVTQDYSANYRGTVFDRETTWSDDEDNIQQGTFTARETRTGQVINETDMIRFMGAYELRPGDQTAITIASGLELVEVDMGGSYAISESQTTLSADVDGAFGLDEGQFVNIFNPVGPEFRIDDNIKSTRIPIVVAFEHGLNNRWTGRASVARDLYRETKFTRTEYDFSAVQGADAIDAPEPDAADQSLQSGPATTVTTNRVRSGDSESWVRQPTLVQLGLGYTRNNLTIDTLIGKEFFTQGTDHGLFSAVSFNYKF